MKTLNHCDENISFFDIAKIITSFLMTKGKSLFFPRNKEKEGKRSLCQCLYWLLATLALIWSM